MTGTTFLGREGIRVVIFDLDGTLALSKSRIADSTANLLNRLLDQVDVAIISGGTFEQFDRQVLIYLGNSEKLARLHLLPTCGTRYYRWVTGAWREIYSEPLADAVKEHVIAVLTEGARDLGLGGERTWGPVIDDRGTQITYSALGQNAPVDAKLAWDPDGSKKERLRAYAAPKLPDLEVRSGGSTSIDVTAKGIDKAYGVAKLQDQLKVGITELLFLGDRLDVAGNDYPVKKMGVNCISVTGWQDTERHVSELMAITDPPDAAC